MWEVGSHRGEAVRRGGRCVCVCVYVEGYFMCGTVMQINDLLQCRAEQHNACTPVHHSTSPVPPMAANDATYSHEEDIFEAGDQGEKVLKDA